MNDSTNVARFAQKSNLRGGFLCFFARVLRLSFVVLMRFYCVMTPIARKRGYRIVTGNRCVICALELALSCVLSLHFKSRNGVFDMCC